MSKLFNFSTRRSGRAAVHQAWPVYFYVDHIKGVQSTMINVKATRPEITYGDTDWDHKPVIGIGAEWDWLFAELGERLIAQIKLIRQLNPGMGLKDAKDTAEIMRAYRNR